jgi:hypothetical protein
MSVDKAAEDVGEIGLGIDRIELAGLCRAVAFPPTFFMA